MPIYPNLMEWIKEMMLMEWETWGDDKDKVNNQPGMAPNASLSVISAAFELPPAEFEIPNFI